MPPCTTYASTIPATALQDPCNIHVWRSELHCTCSYIISVLFHRDLRGLTERGGTVAVVRAVGRAENEGLVRFGGVRVGGRFLGSVLRDVFSGRTLGR